MQDVKPDVFLFIAFFSDRDETVFLRVLEYYDGKCGETLHCCYFLIRDFRYSDSDEQSRGNL